VSLGEKVKKMVEKKVKNGWKNGEEWGKLRKNNRIYISVSFY